MENKRSARQVWTSIAKACAYFGAYIVSQVMVSSFFTTIFMVTSMMKLGYYDEKHVTELLYSYVMELTIISNVIAIFACIVLSMVFRRKKPLEAIDLTPSFNHRASVLSTCAIIGIFGQIAILFILNIIPFPESWTKLLEENNAQITNSNPIIQVISVAIIAPLAEEVIFRAGVQGALSRGLPKWVAIPVASLIFGIMHGNPIGIIYATALGILMGWIYSEFNSIIPSIVFHFAFNSTSLILSLFDGVPVLVCIASTVIFALSIGFLAYIKSPISAQKNSQGDNDNEAL